MSKKSPRQQSIEDLLKTLEDDTVPESIESDELEHDVLSFIVRYDLRPGTDRVTVKTLYRLFRIHYPSIPQTIFTQRLHEHFDYVADMHNIYRYFLINRSSFSLSNTYFKEIKVRRNATLKRKTFKLHYEAFLKAHNIVPGNDFIGGHALYYIYQEWMHERKKSVRTQPEYFIQFSRLYFRCKGLKKFIPHFGIDLKKAKEFLTDEKIQKANDWQKKYQKRVKPTFKNKVSRTRSKV